MSDSISEATKLDFYGFPIKDDVPESQWQNWNTDYERTLTRRLNRWNQVKFDEKLENLPKNRQVKRFVRKGIPRTMRPEVWLTVSGAREKLNSNKTKYTELCKQIHEAQSVLKAVESIDKDLHRTFPEHLDFYAELDDLGRIVVEKSSEQIKALRRILIAHALHNVDVGYCQGLNFLAAMLLLVFGIKNEERAFWMLVVTAEELLAGYFSPKMTSIKTDHHVMTTIIRARLPRLANHLQLVNVSLDMILTPWFMCLFIDCAPTETVLRIWDAFFFEGIKVLFRVTLALFTMHEAEILKIDNFPECFNYVKSLPSKIIDCHDLMKISLDEIPSMPMKEITKERIIAHQAINKADEERQKRK